MKRRLCIIMLDNRLTRREKQCLLLAYHGKNIRETSKILDIKVNTVEWYRKNILKKLNARNIGHAIALGIKHHFFVYQLIYLHYLYI